MKEKPSQRTAGLVRERLASFEEALRIGISHQTTVDQLNKEGFVISLGTFRTNLARARKARDKATTSALLVQTISDNEKLTTIKKEVESEAVSTVTANPIMPTERKKFKEIKLDKSKIF